MAASCSFDVATQWPPVAESFSAIRTGWEVVGNCADSVLEEVDSIRNELVARARDLDRFQQELSRREAQLLEQKADFARLAEQFEQQTEQLSETTAEVALLREAIQQQPAAAATTADKEVYDLISLQLDELRDLLGRAQQPVKATTSDESPSPTQSDPVVNSLFAEFAKAQRNSVRGRGRGT